MIASTIQIADKYNYLNDRFQAAFSFLRRQDLADLPLGSIELYGKDVVANIQLITTSAADGRCFESHNRFFDIQYVISGEERIDWAKREDLSVLEAYDTKKDVTFYKESPTYSTLLLSAGDYLIAAPEDAHRPGCYIKEPGSVKKVVVKIRL